MATIEPRLIHLLNESTTPHTTHADLPPLHAPSFPTPPAERPLPPLDRDTNRPGEKKLNGSAVHGLSAPNQSSVLHERDGRHAGSTTAYTLRMLLGDPDAIDPQFMSRSRSESPDGPDDPYHKKRGRNLNGKDEFMQLPQPLKKQKAAQQALVMPPIINGLHEPPPHPALFPPIASSTFHDEDSQQRDRAFDLPYTAEDKTHSRSSPDSDYGSNKSRKKATKPRRKWSEEETNHLLLGVNRYGVGKWTNILEDADFKFNERTAGDLKDRFRTCCPDELRSSRKSSPGSEQICQEKSVRRKGLHSENILIEDDSSKGQMSKTSSEPPAKPKKSRAHRKNLEDLAELGIHGPFKKSHRRERRPFTETDDREILEGLDHYGPAWTKIQRDPRFHLTMRQPTDLRDRVRNKYPAVYQRIEKGTFQAKLSTRGNDTLEPSVNMSIDNSLKRSKASTLNLAVSRKSSREDIPRWPLNIIDSVEYSTQSQPFEFGEPAAPHFLGGEMDIARLLLDDTKLSHVGSRHVAEPVSSPSSPSATLEGRRERHDGYALKC